MPPKTSVRLLAPAHPKHGDVFVPEPSSSSCASGADMRGLAGRERRGEAARAGGAQGMTKQQFRDIMAVDKKVQDGRLRLILLRGALGSCVVTGDFAPAALEATLDAFAH